MLSFSIGRIAYIDATFSDGDLDAPICVFYYTGEYEDDVMLVGAIRYGRFQCTGPGVTYSKLLVCSPHYIEELTFTPL